MATEDLIKCFEAQLDCSHDFRLECGAFDLSLRSIGIVIGMIKLAQHSLSSQTNMEKKLILAPATSMRSILHKTPSFSPELEPNIGH